MSQSAARSVADLSPRVGESCFFYFFPLLPICVIYFSFASLLIERTLRYFQFGICVLRFEIGTFVMEQ